MLREFGRNGAQGRDRTTDTVIFSHVLYQLSYLGFAPGADRPVERARVLTVVLAAVHPLWIDRRAGNAIAVAEPLQQVAVLASAAAKGRVRGGRGLVA